MTATLLQMTVLMLCGAGWRLFPLCGLSAEQTRLVLTSVVYYFFLPAMVLDVLWQAELGWQSLQLSALGCGTIVLGAICSIAVSRLCRFQPAQTGALVLAAAFPNVTYLGLPVLEQIYGGWARSVVIQIDLFAAAPMVFTLGIALAGHYGTNDIQKPKFFLSYFNTPPFWAALFAVSLNLCQVANPAWLHGLLQKVAAAVAPLMIFSLGLALSWKTLRWRNLPYLIPIVGLKLFALPWCAGFMADWVGLSAQFKSVALLDLAMPSMLLGVVLCDRYRLDSALYATAVTVTTLLSLFSLPFWFQRL